MINNEFKFIGIVTEDFTEIGTEAFPKKQFKIEVERNNKRGANTYPIIVYNNNRNIDVTKSILNNLVIVNGYVDSYKDFIKLIAQELIVVGATDGEEKEPELPVPDVEIVENNDLPF